MQNRPCCKFNPISYSPRKWMVNAYLSYMSGFLTVHFEKHVLKKEITSFTYRYGPRCSGAFARQRSTMGKIFGKSIDVRNFVFDVSVRPSIHPYRRSGWRWGGKTASGDGSVRAIFVVIILLLIITNKPNMAAVYSVHL